MLLDGRVVEQGGPGKDISIDHDRRASGRGVSMRL